MTMFECFQLSQIDALGSLTLFFGFAIFYLLYRVSQSYFFGRRYFVISLVAMLAWLFAVFMQTSASDAVCRSFWSDAAWPSIVLLPTAWTLFLIDYTYGARHRPRPWRTALLVAGPLIAAVTVGTNGLHHLFHTPVPADGLTTGGVRPGPLFYAFSIYLYATLTCAILVTLRGMVRARAPHRTFYAGLFLVTLAPALSNLMFVVYGVRVQGLDPTPFAFSITLFILLVMVAENRLMDVAAIGKDLLFHTSPDPIFVLDVEGNPVGRNPEARRMFGPDFGARAATDGLGTELQDFIAELIETSDKPLRKTLSVRNRYFDPEVFPINQHFGPSGSIAGWVLRLRDSTERRFLSGALQAERDFLSRLMETSMSGILVLDAHGAIGFINAEAERVLGLEGLPVREISLRDPDWQFEWPEGTPATGLGEVFAGLIATQEPLRNRLLSLLRRSDGERRVISVNATLLKSPDADARVVVSLADVTDQHRTEINLRDAAAKSESENRSKSQFIANMSHEIRTPLNGVLGMAEVLDRLIKDPEQKRMITTIRHSGELLLTILNDVLDMSKIEAGKLELESTLFRPDHLAARIEELFSVAADEKQLSFEVYTSGRADIQRIGDPHRLMQILQNLVSNAIKFTHDGEIMVTVSCPAGRPVVIEVRDTGIGMSDEQIDRIFRPFEQADGSVTRRFGGTGLGMAIVAKLVELMDGQIDVHSEIGEGTTIRVTLPLETDAFSARSAG